MAPVMALSWPSLLVVDAHLIRLLLYGLITITLNLVLAGIAESL